MYPVKSCTKADALWRGEGLPLPDRKNAAIHRCALVCLLAVVALCGSVTARAASTGTKILYLYNNQSMSRTPQTASAGSVSIAGRGASKDWTLTPVLQLPLTLAAGAVNATLTLQRTGSNTGRTAQVELRTASGTSLGFSNSVNFNNGGAVLSRNVTVNLGAPATIAAGDALVLRIYNNSAFGNRTYRVYQNRAGVGASTLSFLATTVINVDSMAFYNAAYPAVTTSNPFLPAETVYIRVVVSDPFGSYDIDPASGSAPTVTVINPTGIVRVSSAAMTQVADSGAATKTFEYAYTLPTSPGLGSWSASITAFEGTEGTVSDTAANSFDVETPEPLVMKTVSVVSDPVEGSLEPKAIPGAVVAYNVVVYNTGKGPIDAGSLSITDAVPVDSTFELTASPPFTFTDGAVPSGLSVTAGSDANILYSNNGGATWTYVPTCTRPCVDPAITDIKITLGGQMVGATGTAGSTTGAPYFTLTYEVTID